MMPRLLNKKQRRQRKAERKLEAMVKYQDRSTTEIKMAITSYVRDYDNNFFIMNLLERYKQSQRGIED